MLGTIVDLLERKTKGSFHQLLPEFAAHDTVAFKSYMRMDFEHFSKVTDYLSERLHGQSNEGLRKASLNMLFSGQIVICSKCPTSLTSNNSCVPPYFESARNTRHASRFSKKFLMLMQLTNLHYFST